MNTLPQRHISVVREQVRDIIFSNLLKNYSPDRIKEQLSLRGYHMSDRTYNYYVCMVREEMREKRKMKMEARIDLELNILESIRNRALDSYEESLKDAQIMELTEEMSPVNTIPLPQNATQDDVATARQAAQDLQNLVGGRAILHQLKRSQKTRTVGQSGDPRFLETAIHASAEIRKMLGVDPAEVKRLEIKIGRGHTAEELRNMDPAQLARLIGEEINSSEES